MVGSRLPVPSLLRLFGVLLMLFQQLPMGSANEFKDVSLTLPGVQEALALAVEQFNVQKTNYFKVSKVVHLQKKTTYPMEYRLTVEMVKTACKKNSSQKMPYKRIQECEPLAGDQEKKSFTFVVKIDPNPNEMKVTWVARSLD